MKLYSTLSRTLEDFQPIEEGKVKLFVCGPTVYDNTHIGHVKTYVQFDLLARYLRYIGYEVFYLQNITNIDDKIIQRSAESGSMWIDLGNKFYDEYTKDMAVLNVTSVTKYALATDFIPDIIRQVQTLIDKEYAYTTTDGIYFETNKFQNYGKLSKRVNIEETDAQSRIDQSSKKKNWNDFCLWKYSKKNEPFWPAPFGSGRPGWHIEDTAISEHFFGPQYDIHGGAIDLIFPHHEDEIAQMEAASGKVPFVKYWLHTGFLNIDAKKMSKSLNNFYTLRDVIAKGYDPMAIRLLILQSHYRSPINFSWEALDSAANRLKHIRSAAELRHQPISYQTKSKMNILSESLSNIESALNNDLNTPEALANIESTIDIFLNNGVGETEIDNYETWLRKIDTIFGLNLLSSTPDIPDSIKAQIITRNKARALNDWEKSDKIRKLLETKGFALRDETDSTIWYRL